MSKKYIDIKKEGRSGLKNPHKALMEIAPHDIIFFIYDRDIAYPADSFWNMGYFCQVAYRQDDQIVWQSFHPEGFGPIKEFLAKLGKRVTPITQNDGFGAFVGGSLQEFRADHGDLIYLGEYRFRDGEYEHLGKVFGGLEEAARQRSELFAILQEKGWATAMRIVKKYDDPVDIDYAYDWAKKAKDETVFVTAMTYN